MRSSGVAEAARNFGPRDHSCWVYDRSDDVHSRAMEFLADGLALGQQVFCAASDRATFAVVLRTAIGGPARLVDLLGLERIRVEPAA